MTSHHASAMTTTSRHDDRTNQEYYEPLEGSGVDNDEETKAPVARTPSDGVELSPDTYEYHEQPRNYKNTYHPTESNRYRPQQIKPEGVFAGAKVSLAPTLRRVNGRSASRAVPNTPDKAQRPSLYTRSTKTSRDYGDGRTQPKRRRLHDDGSRQATTHDAPQYLRSSQQRHASASLATQDFRALDSVRGGTPLQRYTGNHKSPPETNPRHRTYPAKGSLRTFTPPEFRITRQALRHDLPQQSPRHNNRHYINLTGLEDAEDADLSYFSEPQDVDDDHGRRVRHSKANWTPPIGEGSRKSPLQSNRRFEDFSYGQAATPSVDILVGNDHDQQVAPVANAPPGPGNMLHHLQSFINDAVQKAISKHHRDPPPGGQATASGSNGHRDGCNGSSYHYEDQHSESQSPIASREVRLGYRRVGTDSQTRITFRDIADKRKKARRL